MKTKTSTAVWSLAALLGLVLLAGCGKKESSEEQPAPNIAAAPAAPETPIDPATAATIIGVVKFEGAAPKAAMIDMSQDPACKGTNTAENVMAAGGHLSNVFVYVKEGLGNRTFDVPKEAITLDQSGCKYHPHVLGVVAGQTIKIVNSDPTTHNIHPTPKDNREWNESQHPWMRMFVNVTKSPFFAVTGPDGKFEIKGLPPGDYTIAFVHEKLGEQDVKVTLAAKGSKTVDATFKP